MTFFMEAADLLFWFALCNVISLLGLWTLFASGPNSAVASWLHPFLLVKQRGNGSPETTDLVMTELPTK